MSNEQSPENPDVVVTRAAVREKAQQVRAKQARSHKIRILSIVTVVALVCVGAGYGIYRVVTDAADKPVHYPTGLDADGMRVLSVTGLSTDEVVEIPPTDPDVTVTEPGATPTGAPADNGTNAGGEEDENIDLVDNQGLVDIHIYVDFMSPSSGAFQSANAKQLSGWIVDGAVTVTYHPVAMLTASSNGTRYSLRAAAAAACVASISPDRFYAFTNELLISQPEVNSDGLGDDELAVLAVAAGADDPKAVRACIEEQRFIVWAKEATSRALAGPLPGTEDATLSAPAMVIANGQVYSGSLESPTEFSKFVQAVASAAYYANNPQQSTEEPDSTEE